MTKYIKAQAVQLTADQVWAAACAAQRINGEYLKNDEVTYPPGTTPYPLGAPAPIYGRKANKHLMRDILNDPTGSQILQEDIDNGADCRKHYQGLMLKELAGTLTNGFLRAIYLLSAQDEFKSTDYIQLAQLSAAPQGWKRDVKQADNIEKAQAGTYVGNAGDKVTGELDVTGCNYSVTYGIYFVHGFLDGNAVFFAFKSKLDPGKIRIKGSVKAQRNNKTTQLNRVKVI